MLFFQVCEHLVEVGSTARLSGFDVFELPHDHKTVANGILAQKTQLGRNAEAFLLLILTGHPYVQHNLDRLLRNPVSRRSHHGQCSRWHGNSWTRSHLAIFFGITTTLPALDSLLFGFLVPGSQHAHELQQFGARPDPFHVGEAAAGTRVECYPCDTLQALWAPLG